LQVEFVEFVDDVGEEDETVLFVVLLILSIGFGEGFIVEDLILDFFNQTSTSDQMFADLLRVLRQVLLVEAQLQLVQLEDFPLTDHLHNEECLLVFLEEFLQFFDERHAVEHPVGLPEVHLVVGPISEGQLVIVLFAVTMVVEMQETPVLPEKRTTEGLLTSPPVGNDFVLDGGLEEIDSVQVQVDVGQLGFESNGFGGEGSGLGVLEVLVEVLVFSEFEVSDEFLELSDSEGRVQPPEFLLQESHVFGGGLVDGVVRELLIGGDPGVTSGTHLK
jgi:hypothetical protein